MEAGSNAQQEGDIDKSKAMKLEDKDAFGRVGMDMSKHKEAKYESSDKAIKNKIEHFTYHGSDELNDACKFTMKKRRLNNKNQIHLSVAISQLAKLRMLQLNYGCIDFCFDLFDIQYQEMDTDFTNIAFSCDNPFRDCIKSELRNHYPEHKNDWFPRDYNTDVAKFDTPYPCLFNNKWPGDATMSLSRGMQQGGGRIYVFFNPDGYETFVRDCITLARYKEGVQIIKKPKAIITYTHDKQRDQEE
ncbi:chromodomain protein, putative [Plasmopara halstedii]|uniref:Chromodomain protein, putative n=1 Tax=Plasmopara halstedii TaxID=4781 RepID=A0A0N7L4K5_PLAHL|nr:chromodomain protein, putative [Plasmopara halstedii]CEG38931.1 chromodomain protein, putative [Plasmopara halstedii]|eukprot:XP_024575300.1 chromodomain protein, putative [Plasmopara halstedii]